MHKIKIVVMALALFKAKATDEDDPLRQTLLDVVQTSLIGSIFSNSLLVLGCSFVANGYYYKESKFNITATSANVSLLLLAAFVMILPGPYEDDNNENDSLMISRAAALVLMLLYMCLLYFVLISHSYIMTADENDGNEFNEEEKHLPINKVLLLFLHFRFFARYLILNAFLVILGKQWFAYYING